MQAVSTRRAWWALGIAVIPGIAAAVSWVVFVRLTPDPEINVGDAFVAAGLVLLVAVIAAAAVVGGVPLLMRSWRSQVLRGVVWCALLIQAANLAFASLICVAFIRLFILHKPLL